MEYFQIKAFSGANTRVESTDQDRGTLRRIEGAVVAPNGGISSPPSWIDLWGIKDLESQVLSDFWTDEQDGYGYFLKIEKDGNSILVFYEKGAGVRGLWWIEQSRTNSLNAGVGVISVTDVGSVEGGGSRFDRNRFILLRKPDQ